MISNMINWVERGLVPDVLIRAGIRHLVKKRLTEESARQPEQASAQFHDFLSELKKTAMAIETDKANEQHYEVDAEFYRWVLGDYAKYSSAYYQPGDDLSTAERRMLDLYVKRAQLSDGQKILELGCGWGSLSLFMAAQFPKAHITGVSNSHSQRKYIMGQAQEQGLDNIEIITSDINNLSLEKQFDRIISIEMFEHIRNYQQLLANCSDWLKADGLMFVHIFCHRFLMYPYEVRGEDDWMSKYFFSGGQMPAQDTFLFFQDDMQVKRRWLLSGQHYEKTANHWLENMDGHKKQIMPVLKRVYGDDAGIWWQRWRIFFMSCAELFGYDEGNQWLVGHYLWAPKNNNDQLN